MKEAKNLVKTGKMNSEILHKLPEFFEEMEKNSVLSRIKGFFTFVNLIWMIAILGIVISIGPSLFFLLRPFIILLGVLLYEFILPFIIFLYKYGFFEFLGSYISIIFIADGMKVNKEWGFFISLTGAGFIFALYFYSILKYGKYAINDNEYIILGTLITLTLFSLSIIFNSQIFSFLATIVFYYFLGFYTGCFGLCYVIGFLNDNDMYRVVCTSFFLMTFCIGLKGLNINNTIFELYRCPIQILGALTYFLGLLIIASNYYYEKNLSYLQRQILFIGSILLVLFFGNFFNLPSLANTAYVFGVLYLMEKNYELFSKITESIWLVILITSLSLWACSLYLHIHSEIIVSILSGK